MQWFSTLLDSAGGGTQFSCGPDFSSDVSLT